MVKKKKSVKRKVAKPMKMKVCDTSDKCKIACMKFASMAFILFLITVWPAAMDLVHKIHWGWFLGAMILFAMGAMSKNCCKK